MSGEDEYMNCPLDENHKILKHRIQFHLVRCKKNHDMSTKEICLFNPIHIVDKKDITAHLAICPDVGRELRQMEFPTDTREIPGTVSFEAVHEAVQAIMNSGESWDDEPPVPTYDAMKAIENRPVIRTKMVAPKAEKKRWRQQERQKMAQLEDKPELMSRKIETKKSMEPLRPPSAIASKSSTQDVSKTSQEENRKSSTVADQLVKSLKFLEISDTNGHHEIKEKQSVNVKADVKSFSSILKENKTPGKQQMSKKKNHK